MYAGQVLLTITSLCEICGMQVNSVKHLHLVAVHIYYFVKLCLFQPAILIKRNQM